MKPPNFPSFCVDAELKDASEGIRREGVACAGPNAIAVHESIHGRLAQAEFLARGLASSDVARQTGAYHLASAVHDELQHRLDARRRQVLG